MKTVLCFVLCLAALQGYSFSQNYQKGDVLQVVAQSGLRLRTSPHGNAGTIRVLDCGESVVVTNTFDFDSSHQDKSGWYDGNWIYVSTEAGAGYVFDAYLSKLALPIREDELCYAAFQFTAPVMAYLNHHYPVLYDEQGPETREDVDQCITYHQGGITMTRTVGEGWQKTDLVFQGYRLTEVVNLLRGMVVGKDLAQAFQDSMIFHKDAQGGLRCIQVGSVNNPIRIEYADDGSIQMSIIEIAAVDGC